MASFASHRSQFRAQALVDEELSHRRTARGLRRAEMSFILEGATLRCLGLPRSGFASAKSAASSICSLLRLG